MIEFEGNDADLDESDISEGIELCHIDYTDVKSTNMSTCLNLNLLKYSFILTTDDI